MSEIKTPHQLADERLKIAYDYAKLGERLAELKNLKALWWKTYRQDYKSDASAERGWDLTLDGQEMETVRLKMKAKEIKSSALKTMIQVMSDEARNQY